MNIHITVQSQLAQVKGSNEKMRMKGSEKKRKGGAEVNQESSRSGQQITISLNNGIPQFKGVNGTGNKAMI